MTNELPRTSHQEYADGLRQIAAFIELHPELPLPSGQIDNYATDTKEEAAAVIRALGKCTKEYGDAYMTISRGFGGIALRFVFARSRVCTRKVVGVETIPAVFVEAHTVPASTKEIVEWECEPILAAEATV
jgi:hypothetical protein